MRFSASPKQCPQQWGQCLHAATCTIPLRSFEERMPLVQRHRVGGFAWFSPTNITFQPLHQRALWSQSRTCLSPTLSIPVEQLGIFQHLNVSANMSQGMINEESVKLHLVWGLHLCISPGATFVMVHLQSSSYRCYFTARLHETKHGLAEATCQS